MKQILIPALALVSLGLASTAMAADGVLPGDTGRPGGGSGIPPVVEPPRPVTPAVAPPAHVPLALALEAAQAIVAGCKQYTLGVGVVNVAGQPILTYIPDGSDPHHTYTAIRKAYSAIVFKADTGQMTAKSQTDADLQAKMKADPNLISYNGGVLLKAGDKIVGAIGVSGAEPGHHDAECAQFGLAKIRDRLK